MDFIIYCVLHLTEAAAGFGALLATGGAITWWNGRHRRRERALFNSTYRP